MDWDQRRTRCLKLLEKVGEPSFKNNVDPEKSISVRDFLEKELIAFSNRVGKNISKKEVKISLPPVFEYYQDQHCGEPLDACITESCFKQHPECFKNKIFLQIDELSRLIEPFLKRDAVPQTPEVKRDTTLIMIVDDDLHQRHLLKFTLTREGYEVLEAQNGLEALDLLKKYKPALIVSDLMMPGMDGFLFFQRKSENPEIHNIPVIFLTAVKDESRVVKGLEMGAEDYLTKPFSPRELVLRIKKVLAKNSERP
ncbi:MAG: hypothetical protein Kow0037_09810 [Calditrichia bacterium]